MEEYGSAESVKKTLVTLWDNNRLVAAILLVCVVLATMVVFGLFGYGMFKALKGSEYLDSTGVPADQNYYKSRAPGLGDRIGGQDFSQPGQGSNNNLSL